MKAKPVPAIEAVKTAALTLAILIVGLWTHFSKFRSPTVTPDRNVKTRLSTDHVQEEAWEADLKAGICRIAWQLEACNTLDRNAQTFGPDSRAGQLTGAGPKGVDALRLTPRGSVYVGLDLKTLW